MRFSLSLLSSTQGVDAPKEDEITIANQIKSRLSPQDAILFDELHNTLKDGVNTTKFSFFQISCFIKLPYNKSA